MVTKPKVIDLFSGCGGFSFGFEKAGFHVVLGVDDNVPALTTFKLNHQNSNALVADLHTDESIDQIAETVGGHEIDVIISGPPCQGFSLTGPRNQSDERNKLFYSVFKLARQLNPKAVIIENVPGLASLYGGDAKADIKAAFRKHGYSVSDRVLFAPDYGVPQIRKRLFFVGLLEEIGTFDFPQPILTKENYRTCSDAISDLPLRTNDLGNEVDTYDQNAKTQYQQEMRNGAKVLYNHVATNHKEHVIDVISQVPEGGNYKDLPPGVGDSRRFNEAWTRYHSNRPSKTIDTGHRNHFHYKLNRVPTIREMARLQTFPDSFVFSGNKTQQNRQVGNAVPPLLGFHIAKQLKKYILD